MLGATVMFLEDGIFEIYYKNLQLYINIETLSSNF